MTAPATAAIVERMSWRGVSPPPLTGFPCRRRRAVLPARAPGPGPSPGRTQGGGTPWTRAAASGRSPPPAQGTPGQGPGVPAGVDDDLPVHDHVVDADGELLRLPPRRRGLHRLRVEHDDVGLEAVAQEPAVGEPDPLRRARRHLPA